MLEILKKFDLVPLDVLMIGVASLLFVALWKLLDKFLFSRVLQVIEAREKLTTGATTSAANEQKLADDAVKRYDTLILEARVEAMKKKSEETLKARQSAALLVQRAEESSQSAVKAERAELQRKLLSLREEVSREADKIAASLVEKVSAPPSTPSSSYVQ